MNLGGTSESWGYGDRGDAFHNGRRVGGWHIGFIAGSVVTFRLDLTGKGTMSVAVDDKPMIHVYDNMKKVGSVQHFIPAVDLYSGSSIEFLGFQ
jgi:hypothetical protein